MSEQKPRSHATASYYENALWILQATETPLLQPGCKINSFVINMGEGGLIAGSYTLPTYYSALQQS